MAMLIGVQGVVRRDLASHGLARLPIAKVSKTVVVIVSSSNAFTITLQW